MMWDCAIIDTVVEDEGPTAFMWFQACADTGHLFI